MEQAKLREGVSGIGKSNGTVNRWSKRGQRKWVSGAGQDEIEDIGKDYCLFKENSGAKMHHCHIK